MTRSADIVLCGAGIAGVATAYELAVRRGVRGIVLVDEREPLTLTSDKGTQAYRNWWPDPVMVQLLERSIDLLESLAVESGDAFALEPRGYLYVARSAASAAELRRSVEANAALAAHLYETRDAVQAQFPYLAPAVSALHVRRAGWMNAVRLGHWLLERAVAHGVTLRRETLSGVELSGGRVAGVRFASGERLATASLILAAGPLLGRAAALLPGGRLPVACELHSKLRFEDVHAALPLSAPLVIGCDPVVLDGVELPPGVHARPLDRGDGRAQVLVLWSYDCATMTEPLLPPRFDPEFARTVLRGMAHVVPGFAAYASAPLPAGAVVDGGYYCTTPDHRPLVGPLAVDGAFVAGGLAGYGVMSSQAIAELVAAHVTGGALPDFASALLPTRFRGDESPRPAPRGAL